MAAIQHRKEYGPLTAGLNSRFLPAALTDKEASVLQNAEVNNNGLISKFPGYTLDGTPFSNASFIRTVFDFRRGTTIDQLLIAASDSNNSNSTYKVDIKSTIGDGTYQYIGHTIGTAAFTHANTTVTGTNTSWTKELKPGDKIKSNVDPDSDYTEISVVVSDTSLTLVAGGYLGTTQSAGAYTARKIWNTNNVPRFITFNNVAVIMDGNGIPQQWDGTSLNELINTYSGTTLTQQPNAAPVGYALAKHKNRLFTYSGSTIYWSHANDQTYWDPDSLETIYAQDGGDIISIVSFADSLFCFKNNGKIYRVFGDFADSAAGTVSYISAVDYSENIGIIADRSVFVHGGGNIGNPFSTSTGGASIFFLAETGVYSVNQYGTIQRISYYIEPTTKTFNFSLGAQTAKSFPFTTLSQWNTGTNSGTYPIQAGTLYSYFDDYRQTDFAKFGKNLVAVAIDSNNTVHIAYVTASNTQQINYVKYYTTGVVPTTGSNPQKETDILPSNAPNVILALSLDVDPTTGNVGLAYSTVYNAGLTNSGEIQYIQRSADSGVTLGTWSSPIVISSIGPANYHAISLKFSPGGVPALISAFAALNSTQSALYYAQRNSGVWTTLPDFDISSPDTGLANYFHASLTLDGSGNPYISVAHIDTKTIEAFKSTNGGTSWTTIETFVASNPLSQQSTVQGFLDHLNNFYSVFSDTTGTIIRRNHTGTTSLTVDSTANSTSLGGLTLSRTVGVTTTDYFYYLNYFGTSPNQQEKYIFETSSSLTNPTSNTVYSPSGSNIYRPNDNALVNNGQVIAAVLPGTNANELIIRRVSFFGFWTGPEQHDSTLTSWGTFVVNSPVSNGNSLTYQIALASSPGASNFNSITSGSIISSNSSLIYNVPKINFSLTNWAGISVGSLILNYIGAGVDSRQAFGISYYDQAYFAVSTTGQITNNEVLVYDIKNSPALVTYSVNCMERFKTLLYAGDATSGNLLVLKNGFDFNGSSYTMDVQTKEDFLEAPELYKDFYKMYVFYQVQSSGSFTFSYRLDNFENANGSTWTDITVDQSTFKDGGFDVLIGKKARSIQFRVQNNAAGQQVGIYNVVLYYGLMDLR